MSVFKRGAKGIYYMKFTCHGKVVFRSTGMYTKREAEQVELQEKIKMEKEHRLPPELKPNKMTLREAIDKTYKEKWAENIDGSATYERAKKVVELIGNKEVALITNDDIVTLIEELREQDLTNGTVNRYLAHLRTALNLCLKKWGSIGKLPYIKLLPESKGRMRVISIEEERMIIKVSKEQGFPDMADLIPFLADTGCRLSNALRLEFKDVDYKTGMIHFWKTKQKKPYSVPMTNRVRAILMARRMKNFSKPFNISIDQVEHAWQRIRKCVKLDGDKDFVIHALRHTCASRLVENDVDLYTVKEWLGHEDISTTQIYSHLKPKKLISAKGALEAVR